MCTESISSIRFGSLVAGALMDGWPAARQSNRLLNRQIDIDLYFVHVSNRLSSSGYTVGDGTLCEIDA